MATTESAGRPPLSRTASAQSAKSDTSGHSSKANSKSSAEQQPKSPQQPHAKSPPSSPKSSQSTPDKAAQEDDGEEPQSPSSDTKQATPSSAIKKDIIDMTIFNQILELDDDETREFSRSMVDDYYSQVNDTLVKMDNALESKNLKDLSDLGHFLKGSSAALGVERVQACCERIQHAGKLRDEESGTTLTESEALTLITDLLDNVKKYYPEARDQLDSFFAANRNP